LYFERGGFTPEDVTIINSSEPDKFTREKEIIRQANMESRIKLTQFPGFGHIGMVNPNVNAKIVDMYTRSRSKRDTQLAALAA
jgi:hypothetical protein